MTTLKPFIIGSFMLAPALAMAAEQIVVQTDSTSLVLTIGDNGRLYQSYLGKRLANPADYANLPLGTETYITHGMEDYFEPALHINHADGNPSTLLTYKNHTTERTDAGSKTVITLVDTVYGDEVELVYNTYDKENVFTTNTKITNKGKKPVEIEKFASSMLHFDRPEYYLTEYNGDWAAEDRKSVV